MANVRFGRLLTAMVTPFTPDQEVDLAQAADLARYLVDEQGNDGLVINGTTGEAPTTSDAEKAALVAAVVAAVGDRAQIVAGVGTYSTRHTLELAKRSSEAGAHGLIVVTPPYSRPNQEGLVQHFSAVADAASVPIMLYDIPHRTGMALSSQTLLTLAEHDQIVAVKDAKGDLTASAEVIAAAADKGLEFAYYCGDDSLALPLLSVGGAGLVGTSTHFVGSGAKAMIDSWVAGDPVAALKHHQACLPMFTGIFAGVGPALVKAGLRLLGREVGGLRLPLVEPTAAELAGLTTSLRRAGIALPDRGT